MKKALVIGIDDYGPDSLSGCVNDATALASTLETNGDGSPNFSVQLKLNTPKKADLKNEIEELFKGEPTTALLYFSGHGHVNETDGYLVTPDAEKGGEGVAMNEILVLANKSKARNKIIILDCCHSGVFGSPSNNFTGMTEISEGVTILTASRDTQLAHEINGHGVFTYLLLLALQGGAADLCGNITPGSVYAYIDQALGPWEQRPIFKTNVSEFTSIREITPRIAPADLRKITEYFTSPEEEHHLDPQYEDTVDDHDPSKVAIFKILQKYESVGLVVPEGEEHMYYAAMNSKSCKLTALGLHYWRLVEMKRI